MACLSAGFIGCDKSNVAPPTTQTTSTPSASPVVAPIVTAQPKAFKGQVYRTIDGRAAITMVSADELELAEGGVNLICKYSKQDEVVRTVVNTLGTTQAVYYRITPEGLQDREGRVFYSPDRLAVAVQEAALASARKAEQEQRRAQQEEETRRRGEALTPQSKQPSITIAEIPAFSRWYANSAMKVTLTDVNVVLGSSTLWFGGIAAIKVGPYQQGTDAPWKVDVGYGEPGGGGYSGNEVYFADEATLNRFQTSLDTAIRAWRAKYSEVPQIQYRGIHQ